MEGHAPAGAARPAVSLLQALLHEAVFADDPSAVGVTDAGPDHARLSVDLELVRTSPLHLTVALTLQGTSGLPYLLRVVYVADFEMDADVPEDRRDEAWREAAFVRAPRVLYPYVRELVANLTARAEDAPLLLPDDPDALGLPADGVPIPPPPAGEETRSAS